jgi:hypothetical protein
MKNSIKEIIKKYFRFAVDLTIRTQFFLTKYKIENPPIIIFTPGKVGSTSVYKSVKKQLSNPIYHVHSLSKNSIDNSFAFHKKRKIAYPLHLTISKYLEKKLNAYHSDVFIITIIREPISRMISSYFQNIDRYNNNGLNIINAKNVISQHLKDAVSYYDNWFKIQIANNFGIDIYNDAYLSKESYRLYKKGRINLMLIRMEDLDENFEDISKIFLNLQTGIKLEKHNIGKNKHYSNFYKKVKNNIEIEDNLIKKLRSTKFYKEFYFENSIK